jgi:cysteine synthase
MSNKTIICAIGNTPLVKLEMPGEGTVFAKLEYANPGGSIKDRSARHMIEHAEKTGLITAGGTLIDASSGNQGIATAMIGAIKGYNVVIAVSEKISKEKLDTIHSYGARTVICPATKFISDAQSYHSVAKQLAQETPNSFMPNQYYNVENARAHYLSLGPELWEQTGGKITHFFAGAGTGGTISGAGKYLKEKNPAIKVIAVDSVNSFRATKGNPKPYSLEGIGIDFDTPVLDYSVLDDIIGVSDDDAVHMLKFLAHHHGILAGPSSGAVAWAARKALKSLKEGDMAVLIFGDSGRAYLSKGFYK